MTTIVPIILFLFGSIVFASFFEHTLHKYIMHRTFFGFSYPFRAHAVVHHQTFKADYSYHLQNESDKWTIPMAWWNGPVLILLATAMSLFVSIPLKMWWGSIIVCIVFASYYATYEYLHWCMHLPKKRRVEKSWLFQKLNGHHVLHHRYMHKNFNVVLPFADLCLGTLMLRSNIKFPQVQGESVPDVQPQK
jgi:hypothetical protein